MLARIVIQEGNHLKPVPEESAGIATPHAGPEDDDPFSSPKQF
jgi:hypothetical protein